MNLKILSATSNAGQNAFCLIFSTAFPFAFLSMLLKVE
jgi:hypothetical protein